MQQVLAVLVLTFDLFGCVRNKSNGHNSFDKKETTETVWYVDYETPNSNGILKRSKSLNSFDKKTKKQ